MTQEKWHFNAGACSYILCNDQVASHKRLAAHNSGCSEQVLLYIKKLFNLSPATSHLRPLPVANYDRVCGASEWTGLLVGVYHIT